MSAASRYDHLSKDELLRLLAARDRRDATRFGLVWEANEIDRDEAINSDFVALDLVPEQSVGAEPWRNLIIEGDNFDALRALRMTHAGRVKCIYIDPPYNTGNRDFVYNDRFVDVNDSWRHSTWCEFMYQRLLLAKDLLRQDGVIFVSIDDNEIFALGMLMKRVFSEANFIANVIWQKRYGGGAAFTNMSSVSRETSPRSGQSRCRLTRRRESATNIEMTNTKRGGLTSLNRSRPRAWMRGQTFVTRFRIRVKKSGLRNSGSGPGSGQ